jgi:hypoxanthine phosphoribosyltransferase
MKSALERSPSKQKEIWHLTWSDIGWYFLDLCSQIGDSAADKEAVVAINRGGIIPGAVVSRCFKKPLIIIDPFNFCVDDVPKNCIIVEDVIDTGCTYDEIQYRLTSQHKFIFTVIFRKPWSPPIDHYVVETDKWVKMPWEYSE